MGYEALEPSELEIKLGSRRRIAVGKIKTAHNEIADSGFDVAAVDIVRIAGQCPLCLNGVRPARENRHAVIAFLAVPNHAVACFAERLFRKFILRGLDLLEADDVGL